MKMKLRFGKRGCSKFTTSESQSLSNLNDQMLKSHILRELCKANTIASKSLWCWKSNCIVSKQTRLKRDSYMFPNLCRINQTKNFSKNFYVKFLRRNFKIRRNWTLLTDYLGESSSLIQTNRMTFLKDSRKSKTLSIMASWKVWLPLWSNRFSSILI